MLSPHETKGAHIVETYEIKLTRKLTQKQYEAATLPQAGKHAQAYFLGFGDTSARAD